MSIKTILFQDQRIFLLTRDDFVYSEKYRRFFIRNYYNSFNLSESPFTPREIHIRNRLDEQTPGQFAFMLESPKKHHRLFMQLKLNDPNYMMLVPHFKLNAIYRSSGEPIFADVSRTLESYDRNI